MATNRADTLDPALLRPGRLDRKIEFPLPDRRQKRLVFQVRGRCHGPARRGLAWRRRRGLTWRRRRVRRAAVGAPAGAGGAASREPAPLAPVGLGSSHAPPARCPRAPLIPLLPSPIPPPCRQVCTSKMNLSDEVDLEDYVSRPDKISAAEISAICQEAGMLAVRKNRWARRLGVACSQAPQPARMRPRAGAPAHCCPYKAYMGVRAPLLPRALEAARAAPVRGWRLARPLCRRHGPLSPSPSTHVPGPAHHQSHPPDTDPPPPLHQVCHPPQGLRGRL
jgi:SpoVK/Ycf46/Vps4 family AAA+-type ATPase